MGAASDDGILEQLSEMELAMPRFSRGLYELAAELRGVTQEVAQATADIKGREARAGGAATAKLIVARKLAKKLEPIVLRMESISGNLLRDLALVDNGMRALANGISDSEEEGIEEVAKNLLQSVYELDKAAVESDGHISGAAASFEAGAKIAKVLKRPLETASRSVGATLRCEPIFKQWKLLIEDALRARTQS